MLIPWAQCHFKLIHHLHQHDLRFKKGKVLAKTAARTDTERSEDIGQLLFVRLQPTGRIEVVRVREVFLVVHVLRPARHHEISMCNNHYPSLMVISAMVCVRTQTLGKVETI
jgi:hypothetical protein